jgi:hypothetical protein
MTFKEAMQVAKRDERFMATIYAMNTLLIDKGIYSREEFDALFVEWVRKEERKKERAKNSPVSQDNPDLTLAYESPARHRST